MTFLSALRGGGKSMIDDAAVESASKAIKDAKCGIKNIDDVFENLPYAREGDELVINGRRWREFGTDFRLGNIRKVFTDMNVPTNVTVTDEAALKKILKPVTPEFEVKTMDDNIASAKKLQPDLNVTATDGTDLANKLSPGSKAKVESSYSLIKTVVGVGAVATGIIATMIITGNVYEDLAAATNNRNGCFITKKINNETTSCKLLNRSCGSDTAGTTCDSATSKTITYNIYIMLHHFVSNNDTTSLNEISTNYGINVTSDNINTVLSDENNIIDLLDYYNSKYTVGTEPFIPCADCAVTTGCLSCDPSATTNSATYVDSSNLPDNFSIQCVTNSSVLDTLVDIATGAGIDIFNAVSDSLSGSVNSTVFTIIIIVLILLAITAVVLKFKSKKSPEGQRTSNSNFNSNSTNINPNNFNSDPINMS